MEKSRFGSVYHDDKACEPGLCFTASNKIALGDSVDGKEISWVKYKDMYIADRCVSTAISWNKLNEQGFVYGVPVKIDGRYYLCRCIEIGTRKDEDCEWNDILHEIGDSNDIWHWKHMYFWGQEESDLYPGERVFCGFLGHDFWGVTTPEKFVGLGFRPVLEELPDGIQVSDNLIGASINVYGTSDHVVGTLLDYTEYDMILRTNLADAHFPKYSSWVQQVSNGEIIVDRQAVTYVQLA